MNHDHLANALDHLLELLEEGDAIAAEAAGQAALTLFATTSCPGDDQRLHQKYERCQLAMNVLYARLAHELKDSATSSRAGRAYAGSEP